MAKEFVVLCAIAALFFQPCILGWCGVGRLLGVCSTEAYCRTRMLSTVSRIRMQVASEPPRASCELPTRSVALSVGFVGSNFHGYQADPTLPTIEQALRDACQAINVAPFKRKKIKPEHRWTASSRTDARVHASRIVVAAPLCISEHDARETSRLTQALNDNLPPDIRVHSACVLPPPLAALDARAHCSHREYSYTIPLSAIASIAPNHQLSPAAVLARTQAACSAFVGARDFHNFCSPVRVPQLRAYARSCWNSLPFTRDTLREGCPVQVVQYNTTTSGALCHHITIHVSSYLYKCVCIPLHICPHVV
jgi:tRNA pseudouridine(38-40) synthase